MAKVGIVMGSDSDMPIMAQAADFLDKMGIDYEMTIISAHREPAPSGISRSQLWIISEGLTQNSVHGLLPHIQTDGP